MDRNRNARSAVIGAWMLGALLLLGAGVCIAAGTAGSLDPDFGGGDGIAVAGPAGAAPREIAIDSSDRTVAVGFQNPGTNYRWFVARYTATGDLDTTFAGGAGYQTHFGALGSDRAMGVAIDASGRILVGGSVIRQTGSGKKAKLDPDFALMRLLPDGSIDTTFGTAGTVYTALQTTGANDQIWSVLAQTDGRIVVAGSSNDQVAVVRYTSAGVLDTTFGSGTGKVVLTLGTGPQRPCALRRDASGRYVFLTPGPSSPAPTSWLVRLLADGSVDGSFGTKNLTTALGSFGTGFQGQDMQLASDGTILVSGRVSVGAEYESLVARFTSGGTLDGTFGSGGATTLGLAGYDEGRSLVLQSDGGIVVAAYWHHPSLGNRPVAVSARLLSGGSLDTDYGTGGIGAYADGGTTLSGTWSAAIDSAGHCVGGGQAMNGSVTQPMIVRWLP